jgi:hypothetical protein
MTATADEIGTPTIADDPEQAVRDLLSLLTETRDNLSIVILKLTQQRDQLNVRIVQAKAILANGF